MELTDGKTERMDSNRDESATNRNHEPVGELARAWPYARHSGRGPSRPDAMLAANILRGGPMFRESPLANKTTSCPSATSSSVSHEMTRSVPPYSLGGIASVKGATGRSACTIIFVKFRWDFAPQSPASRADRARRRTVIGANLSYFRPRAIDLDQRRKRELFRPPSTGLSPRGGTQDAPRLPSHSTRPWLPQSPAAGSFQARPALFSAIFRRNATASVVRRTTDWRAHADTKLRIDWKVRHGHLTSHCGPKFPTPYRTLPFD